MLSGVKWSLQTKTLYHLVHDPAPGLYLLSPCESPAPDVASQRACRPGRKGLQRHTIRPLYLTCTTWTADLRPGTLIDVAAATPEETETPSRSLRVLGTRLERLWNCVQPTAPLLCQSLGSFCEVLCCCDEPPTASPPKRARVYCVTTATHPCDTPIQAG